MVHLDRHLVDILQVAVAAVCKDHPHLDKPQPGTPEEQVAVVKDSIIVLQSPEQQTLAEVEVEVVLRIIQYI
jgi:riboflavin biosynthesis pyrimidine reductase